MPLLFLATMAFNAVVIACVFSKFGSKAAAFWPAYLSRSAYLCVSPNGDVTLARTSFGSGINKLLSSATKTHTHTVVVGMFSLFVVVFFLFLFLVYFLVFRLFSPIFNI